MMSALRRLLGPARWHFQHGPMDVVLEAEGDAAAVAAAHEAAWLRFEPLLGELVAELPRLKAPVGERCALQGEVAQTMWQACAPYRHVFITPMAAVAGSVAQALVACYDRAGIERAWVNNGGDIALHLAAGRSVRVGLFADLARLDAAQLRDGLVLDGTFAVNHAMPVRGVATSGWRGRSFSLGIADSVTVLAPTASQADAAATVIANAVDAPNAPHAAAVLRRPACEVKDDSDLGAIPVTVDVPPLPVETVRAALAAGLRRARELQSLGLIHSAALVCQGQLAIARVAGTELAVDNTAVNASPLEPCA
jgi:uncharacterized protein